MMALTVDRRSSDGETTGTVELDESIFGIQPNVPVLHQVVTAQLAAARAGTQSTKTRAEVSGGGRKPFKQKGTGRARQGSERAPHFTGGGVALGPKPRSYRQKTPRKMIQLALRSALSDRAADDKVVVVDSWPWETPSTRDAKAAIAALGITGRALVVLSREDEEAVKSFRNLTDVQVILQGELNAYDILCNDWIVFTPETLPGGGAGAVATAASGGGSSDAPAAGRATDSDMAADDEVDGGVEDQGDAEDVELEGAENMTEEIEDGENGEDGEEDGDE
jgi:large subunit ribosomal protein L4